MPFSLKIKLRFGDSIIDSMFNMQVFIQFISLIYLHSLKLLFKIITKCQNNHFIKNQN